MADDVSGSGVSTITETTSGAGGVYNQTPIASHTEVDLATKTLTYAAGSRALAVGVFCGLAGASASLKLRLYMGGVQIAESAYLTTAYKTIPILGASALTGSKECKVSVYNYEVAAANLWWYASGNTIPLSAAIIAGSVKI